MSKELPFWNDDETDILPQYQLGYAHAILDLCLKADKVQHLAYALGVGKVQSIDPVSYADLPFTANREHRTLIDERSAWFIVSEEDGIVFAPHNMYFGSEKWTRWTASRGSFLVLVHKYILEYMTYHLFMSGESCCRGFLKDGRITYSEDMRVQAYLSQRRIFDRVYRSTDHDKLGVLIERDIDMVICDDEIVFERSISHEPVSVDRFSMYRFERTRSRRFWLPFTFG